MLGELYGKYTEMGKMEDEMKDWLTQIGISVEKDKILDAAGINDDWPTGRGVFIHDKKGFVVLVNFEDHIQFIVLP